MRFIDLVEDWVNTELKWRWTTHKVCDYPQPYINIYRVVDGHTGSYYHMLTVWDAGDVSCATASMSSEIERIKIHPSDKEYFEKLHQLLETRT